MRWFLLLTVGCAFAQAAAPAVQSPQEALRLSIEKQRAAAARQREAVRIQARNAGASLPGETDRPEEAAQPAAVASFPCDPLVETEIGPLVEQAAEAQDVEPRLIRAVIEQESGLRPCAVSPKGAQGLMQLMPATAQQFSVKDPFDPRENVFTGTKLLKQLIDKYKGDLRLALGAYNAGPAAVDQAGSVPDFPETRDYVKSILERLKRTGPPNTPTPRPTEN